ncbi:C-myc promoter-binding protein-like isoform X3 [Babylonia areolata]|uniref:C-myc promoter-binding protein-like isoform X3 n=1 Tax=Babylonia areolata TaxID=304850 RepID=UPI003FD0127A
MDEQRVADYFVVAGLGEGALPLEEISNEAAIKPGNRQDPITEIAVINRSAGEKIPKTFQCLETTPSGFPANLNHGAIRCPDLFICYKRGRDKPPLRDIGILYEGKERVMEGCEVVHTTPFGRPANINNSSSSRIYVTYRRAADTAASDTLVVVDLCIILSNKGEDPPLTYHQVPKNLNKGMVGSDVYMCYKKAMVKNDVLAYKPTILGRYPEEDYVDFPLPESVPMFCLPMGATIECWSAKAIHPLPGFSTFILTLAGGEKAYGAAVSFYEEYQESQLTDMQMRQLGLKNKHIREQYKIQKTVHVRKAICLLSHWPFFDAFKKFLSQLYKVSITGPHAVPIERHISHFMYDVPYPSPQRPRILVQLAQDSLSLCMPEDSPLPHSGASFITLLRNLGPELCMNLLMYTLLENKILLHSLRPTVLTEVAEAVTSMIFPFHWQCPYIPLCPLGLSDVLNAPCPFIVGIDSRYFDLYDPPPDIICVDLDTNRIWLPDDKKQLNFKTMPKKAVRILQDSLHRLYEIPTPGPGPASEEVSLEMTSVDMDFRRKKKQMQMELLIQEAFLRFMAILLRDYKTFLKPIMKQPNNRATDANMLFDMQGFLKSRDKTNTKFYTQMMKTQMFFRFIEERSFVSDKDASLAFFDECTESIDETKEEARLIETDNSQTSERTVFIMPPEPTGLPEGSVYSYNGFPELKPELFLKKKVSTLSLPTKQALCPNSPLARRSKQEVKSAQKLAQQFLGNPKHWAKCLLSHCYSLWFISFPAFVHTNPNKLDALKAGLAALQKMQSNRLPFVDQVCYRVLMQLAGQYNKPGLAVQVFSLMKRHGVQPNAITYGYYNRVMLEAKWTSPMSKGKQRWTKIRNVIVAVAQFRRAVRRRSISLYSNSGSEFDQISHASVDSYLDDHGDKTSVDAVVAVGAVSSSSSSSCKVVFSSDTAVPHRSSIVGQGVHSVTTIGEEEVAETGAVVAPGTSVLDDRISTGGVSDGGYNSMTQEDVRRLSQMMSTEGDSLPSSSPSPTAPEPPDAQAQTGSAKANKTETWNPLRFSFRQKKRHHSEKQRTDADQSQDYRSRVGSIVRKSISSFGDHDSLHMGPLLGNSAGLLMVSQSFLENGAYMVSGDLRLEMEQATRQRSKSDAAHGAKPTRSMSLFASWRPKHLLNGESKASSMRFSDLAKKEEDDVSLSSLQSTEESQQKTSTTMVDSDSSSGGKCDVKDSGVGLDEPSHLPDCGVNGGEGDHGAVGEGSVDGANHRQCVVEEEGRTGADASGDQQTDSSTAADAQALGPKSQSSQSQEVDATSLPQSLPNSHMCNTDSNASVDSVPHSLMCVSETADNSVANAQKTLSDEVDGVSSNPSSGVREHSTVPTTPVKPHHPTSLGEVGKTLSTPAISPLPHPLPSGVGECRTPVQKQHSLPDGQQPPHSEPRKSLPGKQSDYLMRRSQSLKRSSNDMMQKTNEAITGLWKFASKAASASYSKFNELKQSITTPIKNAASISSLTRSQDDLDGVGSDRGSMGGGEEDRISNSSTSGTIRERLRGNRAHDTQSLEENSCTDGSALRLSQASFGENSLGPAPSPSFLDSFRPAKELRADSVSASSAEGVLMTIAMEVEMSSCSRCSRCHRLVYDEEIMSGWLADDSNLNTTCPFCHAKFVPNLQVYVKKTEVEGKPASDMASSIHLDDLPLSLPEAAAAMRRRCISECLTSATDRNSTGGGCYNYYLGSADTPHSPLTLSIEEDVELPTCPSAVPEMKKDFMTRSSCTAEPLVFPYLSPLVLRKELEYVLDNEGDLCLAGQSFLDQHPIIFWNLVWYFRRLEIPSHLSSFLLTAASFNSLEVSAKGPGPFDSRNILIRPLWDNVHIHDEVGLPMYIAWDAGNKSTVVDALVTETESFSRPCMFQIISSIQHNDVLTAIKLVAQGRRRLMGRRRRFRSLYREILFLSFVACGRENIDHDAFDREFTVAFEEKLSAAEVRRLQADDKPRSANVQWCRRLFCDLEI